MGKIVKFCNSCDEGFAEKFTFCPDCGKSLVAYEMNPVEFNTAQTEEVNFLEIPEAVEEQASATQELPPIEIEALVEETVEYASFESESVKEPVIEAAPSDDEEEWDEELIAEIPSRARASAPSMKVFIQTKPIDVDRTPISFEAEHDAYAKEGQFYVTVIEEKNVKQLNSLLLGSTLLMVTTAVVITVWSLFNVPLSVYAIGSDSTLASLIDDVPMIVEEENKAKKDKDAGGGGGGGKDEKEETTQGDLADQSKNPTRPPDAKVFRSDNFQLKTPPPQTEGNRTYDKKFDRWGDPNGRFASLSNGTGTGGGQGSGTGTGQGSGRGTGNGSGDGSGSGSGFGNGNGDGTGDGDFGPPPPKRATVTQNLAITSKPRPGYTDAARQANIQGTVILRVTFLGSGQIGSISAVKGLPNGLTEKAIAAARMISFKPKMVDGVPQPVTKQIEYTFSIY